jgi:hypothetical protein
VAQCQFFPDRDHGIPFSKTAVVPNARKAVPFEFNLSEAMRLSIAESAFVTKASYGYFAASGSDSLTKLAFVSRYLLIVLKPLDYPRSFRDPLSACAGPTDGLVFHRGWVPYAATAAGIGEPVSVNMVRFSGDGSRCKTQHRCADYPRASRSRKRIDPPSEPSPLPSLKFGSHYVNPLTTVTHKGSPGPTNLPEHLITQCHARETPRLIIPAKGLVQASAERVSISG